MARHYGKEVIYLKIWKGAILGKNTYLKKGHKLDIKYLKIPGQFLQNRTIFDAILVKNGSSIFGAKLLQIGAKLEASLLLGLTRPICPEVVDLPAVIGHMLRCIRIR